MLKNLKYDDADTKEKSEETRYQITETPWSFCPRGGCFGHSNMDWAGSRTGQIHVHPRSSPREAGTRRHPFLGRRNLGGSMKVSLTKLRTEINAARFAGRNVYFCDSLGQTRIYDCRVRKGQMAIRPAVSGIWIPATPDQIVIEPARQEKEAA